MANSSGLIFRISNYDIVERGWPQFRLHQPGRRGAHRPACRRLRRGPQPPRQGQRRADRREPAGRRDRDPSRRHQRRQCHRYQFRRRRRRSRSASDLRCVRQGGRHPLFEGACRHRPHPLRSRGPIDPLTGAYPEYEVGKPEGAPPVTLSDDQIQSSYSTFIDAEGREKIYRIRGITNNEIIKKYWEILTPQGIDQLTDLKNLILKTNAPASLNYVQDLDQDNLPADVEYFLRTSDSPLPLGALVPSATDETAESVRFNTDPGLATGSLVRVTDTATGGGLTAGVNYYFRKLDAGNYSFYDTAADAIAGTETGRVNLTGEITAGIFSPTSPATTNTTTDSISFDPGFATGTAVLVSQTGGGLTAGVNYYIRNLGGGNYSFYDTAAHANDTANEDGRSNLTGNIVAGISTSPTSRAFNPASTDFTNQSVTFDPGFATGTVVQRDLRRAAA